MLQFSMPYLAEKVIDMLYNILSRVTDDETMTGHSGIPTSPTGENMSVEDFQKILLAGGNPQLVEGLNEAQIVKLKVGSVGRMRRMYKNLVEN